MPDPPEIAATFLAHRRGEQDRSSRFHARPDQRLADCDERSQAARVVGNAGALEPRPATRHRNVEFRTKNGVQMCGYHDTTIAGTGSIPSPDIPDIIDGHVFQPCLAQHFRDAPAARPFRPCWRGNRGQRSLPAERGFIGALDERPRCTDSIVAEESLDHVSKL